jgi:hypothetical protein
MEMNAIQIKIDGVGKRMGTLVNTEYEEGLQVNDDHLSPKEKLLYKFNKRDVRLWDVEELTEGVYSLNMFEKVFVAASFVGEDGIIPQHDSIDHYSYIGNIV